MKRVQLGSVISQLLGEFRLAKTDEIFILLELAKDTIRFGLNKIYIAEGDRAVGLRDINGTDFPSEIVDFLKKLAMKIEKKIKIEDFRAGLLEDFLSVLRRGVVFDIL